MKTTPTWVIAVPHMGKLPVELAVLFLRLAKTYGDRLNFIFHSANPVSMNRNVLVNEFLKIKAEWLIFIDDDTIPTSNPIALCRHSNYKVVSAVVPVFKKEDKGKKGNKNKNIEVSVLDHIIVRSQDTNAYVNIAKIQSELDKHGINLIDVHRVGTGCLAIHRDVFKSMKQPYFKFLYNRKGLLKQSEDYYFAENCIKKGYDLVVDLSVRCKHLKTVDITTLKDNRVWEEKQ